MLLSKLSSRLKLQGVVICKYMSEAAWYSAETKVDFGGRKNPQDTYSAPLAIREDLVSNFANVMTVGKSGGSARFGG